MHAGMEQVHWNGCPAAAARSKNEIYNQQPKALKQQSAGTHAYPTMHKWQMTTHTNEKILNKGDNQQTAVMGPSHQRAMHKLHQLTAGKLCIESTKANSASNSRSAAICNIKLREVECKGYAGKSEQAHTLNRLGCVRVVARSVQSLETVRSVACSRRYQATSVTTSVCP